jgi:hypothetical protein
VVTAAAAPAPVATVEDTAAVVEVVPDSAVLGRLPATPAAASAT